MVATAQVTGADRARTEHALGGYGVDRLPPSVALLVRVRAFQVATWLLAGSARLGVPSDQAEPWLAYVETHGHRGPGDSHESHGAPGGSDDRRPRAANDVTLSSPIG